MFDKIAVIGDAELIFPLRALGIRVFSPADVEEARQVLLSLEDEEIALPVSEADELERYEGMRVHFVQRLLVTDNFELRDYGVLGVAPERLFAATQQVAA